MKQKHFIDIQNIREEDTELRNRNTYAFDENSIIQITEKFDGCLQGKSRITLADGTTESIQNIVDNKLDVEVLGYNFKTNKIESCKITQFYNHGNKKKFIKIYFKHPNKNVSEKGSLICTKDHLVYTQRGYIEAQELIDGDIVYTEDTYLHNYQKQMILGSLLGDSSIYPVIKNYSIEKNKNRNHGIVYGHSVKQKEYLELKNKILGTFYKSTDERISGYGSKIIRGLSRCDKHIEDIIKVCVNPLTFKKQINFNWLNELDYIGLAFWYMDDGSIVKGNINQRDRAKFSTESETEEEVDLILNVLKNKFGLIGSKTKTKNKYFIITLNSDSSEKFFENICMYIPKDMKYKLPTQYRFENSFWDYVMVENNNFLVGLPVLQIEFDGFKIYGNTNNYDLETEFHNYFANGILVHNSNACACWDSENNQMVAFSRKQELSFNNTLNGFWNYIQGLQKEAIDVFKEFPNWRIFGEWNNKNKIVYEDTGKARHWYIYDIYDTEKEQWLEQEKVKDFCNKAKLEYINELYYGKFISWEHCRSFMNKPHYGERQEGIVVKNQSKLNNWDDKDIKAPCYLKIVNESFKESMKTKEKVIDLEKENAKQEARKIMESICTINRIEKELYKMRDEGILPEKIEPTDFRTIAQNLPKRIYADLIKEELELVTACGEFGGKMCQQVSMDIAKKIILGD